MENPTNSRSVEDWVEAAGKMSVAAYTGSEASTVVASGRPLAPLIPETVSKDEAMLRLSMEAIEGDW